MAIDSSWHSDCTLRAARDGFINSARMPYVLLAALIAGDLLFIALHCLHLHGGVLTSEQWSIERDRSFSELFQYLKYVGIGLALVHLYRKTRLPVLLGWIGIFAYLLLDDSMRIHERFGLVVVAWIHIPDIGGLRGRDIGELIFAALAVAVLVPVLTLGYVRSSPWARALSADLALLLAALVMCAVIGDAIHQVVSGTALNTVAGIVEDGGEMFALSLTCFYVAQWIPYDARLEGTVRFRPGQRLMSMAFAKPTLPDQQEPALEPRPALFASQRRLRAAPGPGPKSSNRHNRP